MALASSSFAAGLCTGNFEKIWGTMAAFLSFSAADLDI